MSDIFVAYRLVHDEAGQSIMIEGITPDQIAIIKNYCTKLDIDFSYSAIGNFKLHYDLKGKIDKYDFKIDLVKIMEGDMYV